MSATVAVAAFALGVINPWYSVLRAWWRNRISQPDAKLELLAYETRQRWDQDERVVVTNHLPRASAPRLTRRRRLPSDGAGSGCGRRQRLAMARPGEAARPARQADLTAASIALAVDTKQRNQDVTVFPRCDRQGGWKMKMRNIALVPAVLAAAVLLIAAPASAARGNTGFGFNATGISGFPTGAARLTGGGAFNPDTGFVNSAGGFRCTEDVLQGPLAAPLHGGGPVSGRPGRSLGHGRTTGRHDLQVHRGSDGDPEDRNHR